MDKQTLALHIGSKIKELRHARGWSQVELANRLDMGKSTIANYEKGYRSPRQKVLFQLADIFSVSVDDFFPQIATTKTTTQTADKIADTVNKLSEPKQNKVLDFATDQLKLQQQENNSTISEDTSPIETYAPRVTLTVKGALSAGDGIVQEDNLNMQVSFETDKIPKHYDAIAVTIGHSMEPKIKNGDYLFIKDTQQVDFNKIGVFQVDGANYVKKFKGDYLKSLNPNYDDISLSQDNDIRAIGEVVSIYRES